MKKLNYVLVIITAALSLIVISGCKSNGIDLNKYITIRTEGYDSFGKAVCEFDRSAFTEDYVKTVSGRGKSGNNENFYIADADSLMNECIGYTISEASNLKNGNTIELMWDCNDEIAYEDFGVELRYSDITYTVKDLDEVEVLDPFAYLTIETEGVSPHGVINLYPDYKKSEIQYITYSPSKTTELTNGETITITASTQGSIDSFVKLFGTILEPTEIDYVVEGLDSYVMSASQIEEDVLTNLVTKGNDVFISYTETGWVKGYEIESVDYVGNYFLCLKDGFSGDNNYIYMVYHITFIEIDGLEYDFYYYVRFRNLILDHDGACIVDLSDYEKTTNTYHYNDDKYSTNGFGTLDSLFDTIIQPMIERYSCEFNI